MRGVTWRCWRDDMAWIGGLAEWQEGDTVYLSVAFTWKLDEAYARAVFARSQGLKVVAGGPALYLKTMKHRIDNIVEVRKEYSDAIYRHNPDATFASRGCPVGCWFCIVPKMEGKEFTLIDDFPVRPILCDNNLSALPIDYQRHIISRYQSENIRLIDANSGFEPRTFTEEIYRLWKPINKGPWRFAFDDMQEREEVSAVMEMLKDEPASKKRVYVLIGNEPYAECMQRIEEVIAAGCEPHVQPFIKLNALEREPHVKYDWTSQKLKDVARWANGFVWRKAKFSEYSRSMKTTEKYDEQQGLFV